MKKQYCKHLLVTLLMIFALPTQSWAFDFFGLFSSTTNYTATKYPIVLVHGVMGFDSIGPVEYFYGIPEDLRADGATVYVSQVSAANSTEVRGEQLLTEVKQILAATGATKVNLIGHSHGAPTSRYVASVRPDLVASVTSVGGVNKGTKVADAILNVSGPDGSLTNAAAMGALNALAQLISDLSGASTLPQSSQAAINSFSTAGAAKFNLAHPEGVPTTDCGEGDYVVNGVRYFSWNGAQPITNLIDPTDPILAVFSLAYPNEKNDGGVGRCTSHLGQVIRDDYGMNHMDEVNQMFGLVNIFETNPVTLYRGHANRLKNLGL